MAFSRRANHSAYSAKAKIAAAMCAVMPKPRRNANGIGAHMERSVPITLPSQSRRAILFSGNR